MAEHDVKNLSLAPEGRLKIEWAGQSVPVPRTVQQPFTRPQPPKGVGYTRAKFGFDCETCGVIAAMDEQSSDIPPGVAKLGARDPGPMFGYPCPRTPGANA